MIAEDRQDIAIAYLLGELSSEQAATFAREISAEPELATLIDELRETLGAVAASVAPATPPAGLREKVLAVPVEPKEPKPVPVPLQSLPRRRWIGATCAALFAVAALVAGLDDWKVRSRANDLRGELASLQTEISSLHEQTAAQQTQLAELQNRNALSEVKVATLDAQTAPLEKVNAVVVWDAQRQEGLIKLGHLPKPDAGKDYQLWVIDPKYASPVSAGVLSVGDDGTVVITFKPVQPISSAD